MNFNVIHEKNESPRRKQRGICGAATKKERPKRRRFNRAEITRENIRYANLVMLAYRLVGEFISSRRR